MSEETPVIETRENGPLIVKHLKSFRLPDGAQADPKPLIALCRCGQSKNKPYCDGSHKDAGFDSSPTDVSTKDKIYTYEGEEATIYYSALLCCHAAECGKGIQKVFSPKQKPWIQPDSGVLEQIETVVAACPSGALSLSTPNEQRHNITSDDVEITTDKNGPYRVSNIPIEADHWANGQSQKGYVLCRCGLSKNKPFCDGAHSDEGWQDD